MLLSSSTRVPSCHCGRMERSLYCIVQLVQSSISLLFISDDVSYSRGIHSRLGLQQQVNDQRKEFIVHMQYCSPESRVQNLLKTTIGAVCLALFTVISTVSVLFCTIKYSGKTLLGNVRNYFALRKMCQKISYSFRNSKYQ